MPPFFKGLQRYKQIKNYDKLSAMFLLNLLIIKNQYSHAKRYLSENRKRAKT
jgi:hypothetical protein